VCLFALGCEEPGRDRPEGELCSLKLPKFSRCEPRLYCQPPAGLQRLFLAFAGEVGHCRRYLRDGEGCSSTSAACEPGLFCETQSGVCRSTTSIDDTPRGAGWVE
jgi:hypothetical protein